ncbi:limbin isoform X2 [Latimeria chalumnae]|uniref:limbin isoform X2 n=1 Tax=Latimeria chalumnae TaxID=7897 RepID=UPI0003C14FDE|nr:PREDICTED: limbin isoform X2 [Latimeria chalumnae]|eukprot:XP_006007306.1 PREDICTED: limbin isoform X2 [Latimeria chalumnae]
MSFLEAMQSKLLCLLYVYEANSTMMHIYLVSVTISVVTLVQPFLSFQSKPIQLYLNNVSLCKSKNCGCKLIDYKWTTVTKPMSVFPRSCSLEYVIIKEPRAAIPLYMPVLGRCMCCVALGDDSHLNVGFQSENNIIAGSLEDHWSTCVFSSTVIQKKGSRCTLLNQLKGQFSNEMDRDSIQLGSKEIVWFIEDEKYEEVSVNISHTISSTASGDPWSHSWFSVVNSLANRILFRSKRKSSLNYQQLEDLHRASAVSAHGVTVQKCAEVNNQSEPQAVTVKLIINNTDVPSAFDVFQLTIMDSVTGLSVQTDSGHNANTGFLTLTKDFLKVGSFYIVNYTAFLNEKEAQDGKNLLLPVYVTFSNSSQNKTQFGPLKAPFLLTEKATGQTFPSHALHFVGFIVAFVVSFVLVCVIVFLAYQIRRYTGRISAHQKSRNRLDHEHKPENSISCSVEPIKSDVSMEGRFIDILAFEEPQNMLQIIEDLDTSTLMHTDANLEIYRMQLTKDIIGTLLNNLAQSGGLSPHVEKRLSICFKQRFLEIEKRMQEEHDRKMMALAAHCNQETREQMEAQHQKEMAEKEHAEQIMCGVDQAMDSEYILLLDKLHSFQQRHLQQLLLVEQEKAAAEAQRQLAVQQRLKVHAVFFELLQEGTKNGDLKREVVRNLVEDYSKAQMQVEDLMDFSQENQRRLLGERNANRQYLIRILQSFEIHNHYLLNTIAAQIECVLNKIGNSSHLTEAQCKTLLEKAQMKVLCVKQRLEKAISEEKATLHHRLINKRKSQTAEKFQEQKWEQKELASTLTCSRECLDITDYLNHWKCLLTKQSVELGNVIGKLDQEAVEDFKKMILDQNQWATVEMRKTQRAITQELLRIGVPKQYLQQVLEESEKEREILIKKQERQEKEKGKAASDIHQNTKQKLQEQFELNIQEQKLLRKWEETIFKNGLRTQLALSTEDVLKIRHEFHNSFSQLDSNLALSKIQARAMLQAYLMERRKIMLMHLSNSRSVQEKQKRSKFKKQLSEEICSQLKIETLKKCVVDKIHVYEEANNTTEDQENKIHSELLLERAHRLKSLEERLGVCIASLQLQRTDKNSRTLEIFAALQKLQCLLLEELSTSESITGSEFTEIIQGHSHELQELEKNLHFEKLHQEAVLSNPFQSKPKLKAVGLGLCDHIRKVDESRPVSAMLQQALTMSDEIIGLQRQSLKEEEEIDQLSEDLNSQLDMKNLLAHYDKKLKFVAYLVKQVKLPVGELHRVLQLLLPTTSEKELISVLVSICFNCSDNAIGSDTDKNHSDSFSERKCQDSVSVDTKLRKSLIDKYIENTGCLNKKKRSFLKKKHLQPVKWISFSHLDQCTELPFMEKHEGTGPCNETIAKVIDLPDTGEKVFVFRLKEDPMNSSDSHPKKKKKRNFLNFKKTAVASFNIS